MKNKKIIVICAVALAQSLAQACPITMVNDSTSTVIITDNAQHAVCIAPGTSETIDSAPQVWQKKMLHTVKVLNEKLYVYVNGKLKYRLAEKFHSDNDNKNKFTFSEISEQTTRVQDRFDIKNYQPAPKPKKAISKKNKRIRKQPPTPSVVP